MDRGWSDLPAELVGLIFLFLPCVADRVRFGAVCRPWRRTELRHASLRQLPWLLLTSTAPSTSRHRFFCLLSRTNHHLALPDDAVRCCGSFDQWLVLALRRDGAGGYFLFEHFSRDRIALPASVMTSDAGGRTRDDPLLVRKAAMSSSPAAGHDCVVSAITENNSLAYCHPGSSSWRSRNLWEPIDSPLEDLIFHDGEQLRGFHAITAREEALVFAVHEDGGELSSPYVMSYYTEQRADYDAEERVTRYLVESGKNLLMVLRYAAAHRDRTCVFRVYAMAVTDNRYGPPSSRWVEYDSLDGDALFVGCSGCKKLPASRFPGLRPDCIYFVDDERGDVGVYSMRDACVVSLFPVQRPSGCSPPVWYFFSN